MLALIASAVGWAMVSQVDMIVTAQGKLITTRPNLVVQPLETSVIREIHVKAGDRVNKGDLLATLDPTFSQADLDQLRKQGWLLSMHRSTVCGRNWAAQEYVLS